VSRCQSSLRHSWENGPADSGRIVLTLRRPTVSGTQTDVRHLVDLFILCGYIFATVWDTQFNIWRRQVVETTLTPLLNLQNYKKVKHTQINFTNKSLNWGHRRRFLIRKKSKHLYRDKQQSTCSGNEFQAFAFLHAKSYLPMFCLQAYLHNRLHRRTNVD